MDWKQLIQDVQPLTSFVGAVLSLAVLGFISRLYSLVKDAQEERIKVIGEQKSAVEERLKNAEVDLQRTEKWYDREVSDLKEKLSALLEGENITIDALFNNPAIAEGIKADIRSAITYTFDEMKRLQERVKDQHDEITDPSWHIQMAKAATTAGNWLEAAQHYDEYLKYDGDDWEIHFLRGVAYANARSGDDAHMRGLRSYSEAIALAPTGTDDNTRARLHTYRAALLKRLNRLDEAESELLLANRWASAPYEVSDNHYNLACVYALMQKKEKMLHHLGEIASSHGLMRVVKTKSYFAAYRNDPDFRTLTNGG